MNKLSDYYAPPHVKPKVKKCTKCRKPALSFNAISGLCGDCQEKWVRVRDEIFKQFMAGAFS